MSFLVSPLIIRVDIKEMTAITNHTCDVGRLRPGSTYAIDFETYYDKDCSITRLGTYGYTHHPSFHAYLVAVVEILTDKASFENFRYVGDPADCPWDKLKDSLLVAHNAAFDQAVAERLKELGTIPPDFFAEWGCTADLAAYLNAPRDLKGAAEVLLGVKADKTVRKDMSGVTWKQAQAKGWHKRCLSYVTADAELSACIWANYAHLWPDTERRMSELNRRMAKGGICVDHEALDKARFCIGSQLVENTSLIPWATDAPIASRKAFNNQCALEGITPPASLDKSNPITQSWFQQHGKAHPWVAAVTRHRSLKAMMEKLNTLRERIRPDGMAEVNNLRYCGAATGRFSGDSGFNIQNLHRGEHNGVDMRSLFIPSKGHKFVISDLAQIEARLLLYLAGDKAQLDMLRDGSSIYEVHARSTMGYQGADSLKQADPELYKLAKARVLGLGYGCGAERFRELAASLAGITLSADEAEYQVNSFRNSNPMICNLWRSAEQRFKMHLGGDYNRALPSGRSMIYRHIHTEFGDWKCVVQGRSVKEYGGKLVENLVQATARDLFVEMLLAVDALPGVTIRLHVHDEIVAEVAEEQADTMAAEINRIMSTAPDWLSGCPLAAETIITDHYTK